MTDSIDPHLRQSLINQGWTPPAEPSDEEAWRPAYDAFWKARGVEPRPGEKLGEYDLEIIAGLKAARKHMPVEE